jgi:hypothetical protein
MGEKTFLLTSLEKAGHLLVGIWVVVVVVVVVELTVVVVVAVVVSEAATIFVVVGIVVVDNCDITVVSSVFATVARLRMIIIQWKYQHLNKKHTSSCCF